MMHASNGPAFAATFPSVRKSLLWRHFKLKTIILPRQARDKHTENVRCFMQEHKGNDGKPFEVLITIVGFGAATESNYSDVWFTLAPEMAAGYRLYDLYRGVELHLPQPLAAAPSGGGGGGGGSSGVNVTVSVEASMDSVGGKFGPSGFGALLLRKASTPADDDDDDDDDDDAALTAFLAKMKELSVRPLGEFSCEGGSQCLGGPKAWPFYRTCSSTACAGLLQTMVEIKPTVCEDGLSPTFCTKKDHFTYI